MEKKKILIVCSLFYPDENPRSYRATELAKELSRQGHEVTVMATEKEGIEALLNEYPIRYINLGKLKWRSPKFGKGRLSYLLERAVYRFLSLGFEFPNIELYFKVKKKLRKVSGFDGLISIAVPYPIHWGVAAVWEIKRKDENPAKVWIADCGDPYYGQENDSFKRPFYWAWVEKWFMRKVDYVAVPTSTSHLGYFDEFHSKIKVIPQGFKFEDYQYDQRPSTNDVPTFAYAGLFIPGRRDPSAFCQFLLVTKKDFRFHIYTRNSALVLPFVNQAPDKFILHDFMPRNQLLQKLHHEVDFVLNIENVGPRQTPSKLIDYILINKPILSIKSFDLDKDNINSFLSGDYSGALEIENRENYRIENVTSNFLSLI